MRKKAKVFTIKTIKALVKVKFVASTSYVRELNPIGNLSCK